ncbi:MAG: hypothetical protein K0S60_292 [Evtepia sp.]|nr:hypothetical protein [Evtepia sp.]
MYPKWRKRLATLIAGLMFIASSLSVLAAVQGSKENPLITLSYLTDVFSKTVVQETDQRILQDKTTYEKKLDDKIASYRTELNSQSGSGGTAGVFSVVDLASGQMLTGSIGCEIMLRVGSAQCVSTGSPGLIDATSGTVLENNTSLVKNHLYMVTVEGRSVKAVGGAVKLMVQGSYSVK